MSRFRKYLRPSLSLCALFLALGMLVLLGVGTPASVPVATLSSGASLELFADWQDYCLAAFTGSGPMVVLDRRTGEEKAVRSFSQEQLLWAAQRGQSLFGVVEDSSGVSLVQFSLPDLVELSRQPLPDTLDLTYFDCDGDGRIFYTQNGTLWTRSPMGQPENLGLTVTFLEVTPQGTVVTSGSGGLRWGPSSQPDSWEQTTFLFPLSFLLGESHFVTALKTVYALDNPTSPVGSLPVTNSSFCDLDQKGNLVLLEDTQVTCSTLSGEPLGSATLSGTPLAVCGSGALWTEQKTCWFTPLEFYQESTPTPDPSVEPEQPDSSVTPDPSVEPEQPDSGVTPDPSVEPEQPDSGVTPDPSVEPEQPDSGVTPDPSVEPEQPDSGVTPDPSVEPEQPDSGVTPDPTPSDPLPDFVLEGDTLLVSAGVTADQLRAWMIPQAISIQRPDGTEVVQGRLATGMTAGSYSIVVLGDCDGSGSVDKGDLRKAQEFVLETPQVDTPYQRAADLDGDWQITTQDLVLLAQAAAE